MPTTKPLLSVYDFVVSRRDPSICASSLCVSPAPALLLVLYKEQSALVACISNSLYPLAWLESGMSSSSSSQLLLISFALLVLCSSQVLLQVAVAREQYHEFVVAIYYLITDLSC